MTERKSFEIDEELRDFLPAVPEMTDQQLEQNLIATGGPKDKLRVWLERNVLVDGYRRFGICQKLGLPYEVEYLSFPNKDAAKLWMLVYQLSRRNVVATQHQLLIAMLHDLEAKVLGTQAAAEKVATETGVSERTVYRAKDYKSALESLSEEIQEKIRAKTIKTSMESVIALANLSPVHQLATIANVENGTYPSLGKALKTDSEPESSGGDSGPTVIADTVSVKPKADKKPSAKPGADYVKEAQMHLGKVGRSIDEINEVSVNGRRFQECRALIKQLSDRLQQWWKEVE